jgi:hypothetical protein
METRGGRRERNPVHHNGVEYRTARACPVYNRWHGMMDRCFNPKSPNWENYGARGITVHPQMQALQGFLDVMGLPPTSKHQVDRYPNNSGHYEPGNVRWATPRENLLNQDRNMMLIFDGKSLPMSAWAERIGISRHMLWARINKYGWTVEQALTLPKGSRIGRPSP